MAVSSISAAAVSNTQSADQQQFRQQLTQLFRAVKSGDLNGAQQAYDSLTEAQAGSPNGGNGPLAQVLDQIGQSLKSGDLAGAQSALQSFQTTLQAAHHGHHHHHKADSQGTAPNAASAADASTAPASQQLGSVVDTKA